MIGAALPPGMDQTPLRVIRAWHEMTAGYEQDPRAILRARFDADGYDEVVVLRDVPFQSLCEHHLMPFSGTVAIAYLPRRYVVGLSKLARVVDCYARRFQIQERMTCQIAAALSLYLRPRAVAVVVRGTHSCMTHRGVTKPGSVMVTSDLRGTFRKTAAARAEVMELLR